MHHLLSRHQWLVRILWLLSIAGIWALHCDASTECLLLSYFGKHTVQISWDLANAHTIYDRFTIGQLAYFAESIIMKSMVDWKIVSHLRTHGWTHNAIIISRKISRPYGSRKPALICRSYRDNKAVQTKTFCETCECLWPPNRPIWKGHAWVPSPRNQRRGSAKHPGRTYILLI